MEDKDLNQLRKSIFGDVEKKSEASTEKAEMFQSLFGDVEHDPVELVTPAPQRPPLPDPQPESAYEELAAEAPPQEELSAEELEVMNLREIKMMISQYRLLIAQAEKRIKDMRYKLSGLETEYRVLAGEPVPPSPAPAPVAQPSQPDCVRQPENEPMPDTDSILTPGRSAGQQAKLKQKTRPWEDAHSISLEEAAWRILLEEGKSMPPWRVAAAIRRKGVKRQFTEDALVGEVRRSKRLGISGGGHVHIR